MTICFSPNHHNRVPVTAPDQIFGMLSTAVSLSRRKTGGIITAFLFNLPALVFSPVSRAYAVQTHGGAEGLVSHQLSHFLFHPCNGLSSPAHAQTSSDRPRLAEFRGFRGRYGDWFRGQYI